MTERSTCRLAHGLWLGTMLLWVADDGRGSDPRRSRVPDSRTCNDRVEAVGGALIVTSTPGSGTTIRGRIPVERA